MIALIAIVFCVWAVFSLGKWWANEKHQDDKDLVRLVQRYAEADLKGLGLGDRISELRKEYYYYSEDEIKTRVRNNRYTLQELNLECSVVVAALIVGQFLEEDSAVTLQRVRERVAEARSRQ